MKVKRGDERYMHILVSEALFLSHAITQWDALQLYPIQSSRLSSVLHICQGKDSSDSQLVMDTLLMLVQLCQQSGHNRQETLVCHKRDEEMLTDINLPSDNRHTTSKKVLSSTQGSETCKIQFLCPKSFSQLRQNQYLRLWISKNILILNDN